MQSDTLFTASRFNHPPAEPSIDIIKKNLKYLKIRPKDVDDILKDAQNAYKMVFEQVLLVMRYVRCLMIEEQNALAIRGRMSLLLSVFDSQENADQEVLEKIQKGVLQHLESNVGSNDVIAYLQSLESDESASILRRIQENGVAFAPVKYILNGQSTRRPYAYYDMYMCLQHPLEIFEKLLSQKVYDENKIERLIYDKVKSYADRVDPHNPKSRIILLHNNISEKNQRHILELIKESNFAQVVEYYTAANKDSILREVTSELAIELGEWASNIFAQISNPSYSKILASKPWRKQLVFNEYFDISHESERTIISLNSGLVNNMHKLNQLDDLFDSLKLALKAKLNSQTGGRPGVKEQSINNEDALSNISAWYEKHSTGMLKKIDQIPKAVISIIYFDLKNGYPSLKNAFYDANILKNAYDKSQEKTAEKRASPIRERNLLLTYIISLNLYLSDHKRTNLDDLKSRIERDDVKNIDNLITLNNPIMSSWTIFTQNKDGSLNASFDTTEQEKMMYRFKTIPVFFKESAKNELSDLAWIIAGQSSTEKPQPFPYNSSFPWPLWIQKAQIKEADSGQDEQNDALNQF